MIPLRPPTDEEPANAAAARDLAPFFAAARETACRLPEPAVQWNRVSTLVRRRRRLRLAAVVAGALCLAPPRGSRRAAWAGGRRSARGRRRRPGGRARVQSLFPADGIHAIVIPRSTLPAWACPFRAACESGFAGARDEASRSTASSRPPPARPRDSRTARGGRGVQVVVVHAGGGVRSVGGMA